MLATTVSSSLATILLQIILLSQITNIYSYSMLLQGPGKVARYAFGFPSLKSARNLPRAICTKNKNKRRANFRFFMLSTNSRHTKISATVDSPLTESYNLHGNPFRLFGKIALQFSRSIDTPPSPSPVSLRYVEFKSGTAQDSQNQQALHPPVIFMHGLLGQKRNFDSIGRSLVKQLRKSRRVLAVDLRNHGENFHDFRDDMSFASMASDIVALLDFNGIKDAVLVGHSMGGKVAQATALLYPNRVSGLVVLDIAPVTYTQDDGSWRAVQTIIHAMNSIDLLAMNSRRDVDAALKKNGVEDPALRSFVMTNLNASASSTDVPKTNSALQNTALQWKINLPSIVKQLDVIAGFELPSEYNALQLQYHGDTFIISGGASRFIRSGHMKIISNFFPNHMLTTVRGVGHWIHAEAPDDTIALLKRYLDR